MIIDPLSHPYVGQKVMDGYGRKGVVGSYNGCEFRIDFENPSCAIHRGEKEVSRMIALADAFETMKKETKGKL